MLQAANDLGGYELGRLVNSPSDASAFQLEGMASDILKKMADKSARDVDAPIVKSRKRTKSNVSLLNCLFIINVNSCVLCVCCIYR